MPAKSEKQRKFFGAVMGAKKHQKGVKGAAKKVAKDMPEKEIKKFLKKESYEAGEMFEELFETFMSQFYVTEATRASYDASKDEDEEEMADKDYDGDGEVESKKDEYFGSKNKAIKKAMHKQKQ